MKVLSRRQRVKETSINFKVFLVNVSMLVWCERKITNVIVKSVLSAIFKILITIKAASFMQDLIFPISGRLHLLCIYSVV